MTIFRSMDFAATASAICSSSPIGQLPSLTLLHHVRSLRAAGLARRVPKLVVTGWTRQFRLACPSRVRCSLRLSACSISAFVSKPRFCHVRSGARLQMICLRSRRRAGCGRLVLRCRAVRRGSACVHRSAQPFHLNLLAGVALEVEQRTSGRSRLARITRR